MFHQELHDRFKLAADCLESAQILIENGKFRDSTSLLSKSYDELIRCYLIRFDHDSTDVNKSKVEEVLSRSKPKGAMDLLQTWHSVKKLEKLSQTVMSEFNKEQRIELHHHSERLEAWFNESKRTLAGYLLRPWQKKSLKHLRILGKFAFVAALIGSLATAYYRIVVPYGHGLKAEYFTKSNLDALYDYRVDQTINFNWDHDVPWFGMHHDQFSVRWSGQVNAETEGSYTFVTEADDGIRVWINSRLIIDDWKDHSLQRHTGSIHLTKGWHDIKVEYFDKEGAATVRLKWIKPEARKAKVVAVTDFRPPRL